MLAKRPSGSDAERGARQHEVERDEEITTCRRLGRMTLALGTTPGRQLR
jgi:hypothetical protein